jgi:hypothetical protein
MPKLLGGVNMSRNFGVTRRAPLTSRGNPLLPDMRLEEPSWLRDEMAFHARRRRAEGAKAFFWWTVALAVSLSTLVALQRGLLTWLVGP